MEFIPKTRKPPGGECSNIFGEAETVVKVSTRPNPSLQSSIFSDETCKPVPSKPKTTRRDPITGEIIEAAETEADTNKESKNVKSDQSPTEELESNNPHLGPTRNTSGVRCAQPPGGRSSVTLG